MIQFHIGQIVYVHLRREWPIIDGCVPVRIESVNVEEVAIHSYLHTSYSISSPGYPAHEIYDYQSSVELLPRRCKSCREFRKKVV